jgi:hypothetical protein
MVSRLLTKKEFGHASVTADNGTQQWVAGPVTVKQMSNGSRTGSAAASLGGTQGLQTVAENTRIGNVGLGGGAANGGPPAASSAPSGSLLGLAGEPGRKH